MHQLTHGTPIRAASWNEITFAKVFTVAGYAAENGKDPEAEIARAKSFGHALASTIYTGAALLGDRAEAARRNDAARATVAQAVTVKTGDRVLIDGVEHEVRFARYNEHKATPMNSDPISFVPVA